MIFRANKLTESLWDKTILLVRPPLGAILKYCISDGLPTPGLINRFVVNSSSHSLNVSIFWFIYYSLTVNQISLGCGHKSFEESSFWTWQNNDAHEYVPNSVHKFMSSSQ